MRVTATILIALFLLVTSEVFSQILVGPVAGANFSWVSFDDKDLKGTYKVIPMWGYHAGMHVAFKVRKRFFLHSSFLYSTKGKVIEGKDDEYLRNEVKYSYIDVPILYTVDFKGKIGKSKEFKYYLGIGPNISYWLGGKGTFNNSELVEVFEPELSYKVVFKQDEDNLPDDQMNVADPNRLQLGLAFGAGLEFEPAPRQRMMLTLRYELGHTFFSKTSDGYFSSVLTYQDEMRSRNQGLRLSVAYLVDLKTAERKKGKSTINKNKLNKKRR